MMPCKIYVIICLKSCILDTMPETTSACLLVCFSQHFIEHCSEMEEPPENLGLPIKQACIMFLFPGMLPVTCPNPASQHSEPCHPSQKPPPAMYQPQPLPRKITIILIEVSLSFLKICYVFISVLFLKFPLHLFSLTFQAISPVASSCVLLFAGSRCGSVCPLSAPAGGSLQPEA